jgi:alkylation response protein AidB-like acyl-CoA dehydrogenase
MDFTPDPELSRFREDVRTWIRASLPEDIRRRAWRDYHVDRDGIRRWMQILHAKGWSAPHWPKAYGGPGWTAIQNFVFHEELRLAGAPVLDRGALELAGPVIYTFGTQEQKDRFLPGMLTGDVWWAQGFSEPGSGSDLVSLTTRADYDAQTDEYVVNGTKLWTSDAQHADMMFALVRTDPQAKPQKGISFLMIDLRSQGVERRPIYTIDEGLSVNQFFFDDVRVPASNLIGEPGKGWTYAKFLLTNERTMSAEVPHSERDMVQLERIARQARKNGRPLIEDPAFRLKLARLSVEVKALKWAVLRVLHAEHGDSRLDAVASVLKIRGAELRQRTAELSAEALGDHGVAVVHDPDSHDHFKEDGLAPDIIEDGYGITHKCMYRRTTTIYGGSNEIQRNIIAKAILGL